MRKIFQAEKVEECVAPGFCDHILRWSDQSYISWVVVGFTTAGASGYALAYCAYS